MYYHPQRFYNSKFWIMKFQKSITLTQIFTLLYAFAYMSFISGSGYDKYSSFFSESNVVFFLFILFLVGLIFSWFNKMITGMLFIIWNIGMWILELFIVVKDGGFGIIAGIPLIVLGVFFIVKGMEEKQGVKLTYDKKWKTLLKLLTITYTLLYLIVVINDMTSIKFDYSNNARLISLALVPFYLVGFVFSFKRHLLASLVFVLWYLGVKYVSNTGLFQNSGPWDTASITILIQGLLYFFYWFKIKSKMIHEQK